jgi:hypothetical protein
MSTTQQAPRTFDWPAFRRAYERFDTAAVREMCAADIVYTEIDSRTPPSAPRVIEGLEPLVEQVAAMADGEIESRVVDEVLGDERVAFSAECRLPDGARVFGMVMMDVEDGLITRMTCVQAFDEVSS